MASANLIALWFATAAAQVPEPAPTVETKTESPVLTKLEVDRAFDAIVLQLTKLGWQRTGSTRRTTFRGPESWHGRAFLSRNGELTFRGPAVVFRPWPTSTTSADPRSAGEPEYNEVVANTGFQLLPSRRKREPVYAQVKAELAPLLATYRELHEAYAVADDQTLLAAPPASIHDTTETEPP